MSIYSQDKDFLLNDTNPISKDNFAVLDFSGNQFDIIPAAGMEILEEDEENEQLIQELLDYAYSFMGTRYRRGGKTPQGFDCSGFTGFIFNEFGFRLNADSGSQFLQGDTIENRLEILPGDLVFFSGSRGGNSIGHVGIAVETHPVTGEVLFIHSAVGGGIKLDSTSEPYYAQRYKGARRIIK